MKIYVLGYLGSDTPALGKKIATEKNYDFYSLDEEIEKKDGRSVKRLAMTMGEHAYRNEEYEILAQLSQLDNIVIACGDGAPLDNMSYEILKNGTIVIAQGGLNQLWEKAKSDDKIPYAFMYDPCDEDRKDRFSNLYQSRYALYNKLKSDSEGGSND